MANPNFKGRPVGSGKSTFIEDPLMENYKIAIDEYSYNIIDTNKGKTVGYHTSLPQAVLSIAKYLMLKDKSFTLTQYAKEFKETHLQLKEAILKWVVQEHLGQWEENIEDIIPIKWPLIGQIEYNKEKLNQMSKLRPVNGNVIIRPIEEEEQMSGNIIIPDMGKERPEMGEIVAISKIYNFNKGEYVPTIIEIGMKVLIPKMGAQSVTIDGEEYYITAQSSILSIIE